MRVSTNDKSPDYFHNALKDESEPCALVILHAHGAHEMFTGSTVDEAILIPASVLEEAMHADGRILLARAAIADLARRIEALEQRTKPLLGEAGGVPDGGKDGVVLKGPQPASGVADAAFLRQSLQGVYERRAADEKPGGLSGVVIFDPCELEGLDEYGFKSLLRVKIDDMAEMLVRMWKERDGDQLAGGEPTQ